MMRTTENRRRPIPDSVKLQVALRRFDLTTAMVRFDHAPPLVMREWDDVARDTIPAANDPDFIQMLLVDEDKVKTFGRGGEKRISTADGDIGKIAKMRRNAKREAEFRARLLAKATGAEPPAPTKRKRDWPTRPFPNRKRSKP